MRSTILVVAVVALGALPSVALAQVVGMDPTYTITKVAVGSFTTISTNPSAVRLTAAGVNADDQSFPVTTAAPFTFYGVAYTTVSVSTNGLITLNGANSAFTNTALSPTTPANPSIAAYWDDLFFFAANPGALYSLISGTTTTLEWNGVGYFGQVATSVLTFQAILNSANSSIQFNYPDTSGPAGFSDAASATVGIKGTAANTFIQVGFNQAGTVVSGNTLNVTLNPVPEPGTLTLCGLAVAGGLAKFRRRKAVVA